MVVLLLITLMLIALLIHIILSSSNCLSALFVIPKLLGVLMLFLSFKLTGVIPTLRHLRVNLLWLLQSPIFIAGLLIPAKVYLIPSQISGIHVSEGFLFCLISSINK